MVIIHRIVFLKEKTITELLRLDIYNVKFNPEFLSLNVFVSYYFLVIWFLVVEELFKRSLILQFLVCALSSFYLTSFYFLGHIVSLFIVHLNVTLLSGYHNRLLLYLLYLGYVWWRLLYRLYLWHLFYFFNRLPNNLFIYLYGGSLYWL